MDQICNEIRNKFILCAAVLHMPKDLHLLLRLGVFVKNQMAKLTVCNIHAFIHLLSSHHIIIPILFIELK